MRYLAFALLLISLARAQDLPAKYLSNDGGLALYLYDIGEGVEAALMMGYGLLFPIEVELDGDRLTGEMGDGLTLSGVLEDEALRLSLVQDGERQELTLTREQGMVGVLEGPPLLSMLSLVPDTPGTRQGTPSVSYADYGATQTTDAPRARADVAALTDDARRAWMMSLQRLRSGPPDLLQYALPLIENMPDLLGFEWFDIERALGYGTPPRTGMLVAVDVNPEGLAQRLVDRDFVETTYQGVTIWRRQEDAQTDLTRREPGDPFVGPLGMAARIAVLPGYLANARFAAMTRNVVDTFRGDYPSLAQAPEYRALAEVISAEGRLIQAQFWGPLEVGYLPGDPLGFLGLGKQEAAPQEGALPPYGLAVLADRQEGPEQVNLIALLYEDADTAERAAGELTRRLKSFHPAENLREWRARIAAPSVFASDAGLWVAVASVRYPLPAPGAEAAPPPGIAFARWLNAIFNREFHPLRIGR